MVTTILAVTPAWVPTPANASPSGGALAPQLVLEVDVVGIAGIPIDASAVAMNVTVAGPAADGYLSVFPCDEPEPDTSNLNYRASVDGPNAVISRVSAYGTVCIATSAATDVIVDISGYFPAGSPLEPLTSPERILDTRNGVGATRARVPAGATLEFQVGGQGNTPNDASAAVINVTAVNADAAGYATVFPCGQPVPVASNLNFSAGQTIPGLVVARLGTGGRVCVTTTATIDLLADVSAYFPVGAVGFTPIANPERVLDTRNGIGAPAGPARADTELGFQVAGRAGVPAGAIAVALNVTATQASAVGYTTVYPCGSPLPATSSLNFQASTDRPNLVIAKIGVGGRVCTRSSTDVGLLADVAGYFEGTAAYAPLSTPHRAADTRLDGQLRCNLSISHMANQSVTVTNLGTGAQRTVSNPLMADLTVSRMSVLADCSGFIALVPAGQIGEGDLVEFKFEGSARVLRRTAGGPPIDVLDDGTPVILTGFGVINAVTGLYLVRFYGPFGQPLGPFDTNASFLPVGVTGDGVAAYQFSYPFSSVLSDITYWDVHDGAYLGTGPAPIASGVVARPALSRYGMYMSTITNTAEGVRISVETPAGVHVVTSPFTLLPPPSTSNYVQWIGDGSMLVCQHDGGNPAVYRWDLFSAPTLLYRGACPAAAA